MRINLQTVGIIGAGQMGSGIAQVCGSKGLSVILVDVSEAQLEGAKTNILKSVTKLTEKGQLTAQEKQAAETLITYSRDLTSLKDVDLVIEAVSERESLKKEIFEKLDAICKPAAILASNTSSLPITRLASYTKRPHQFVGMHFMNPVPLMKLVEVISGLATSPETLEQILALAQFLGKEVSHSKDYPGFVVNRILMPMINEAFTALLEGVASPEDIDKGMKLGTNQPMGPLALADFIGLDTCLSIMRVMHEGFGDSKYRPSPLLVQYVDAGWLGRKVGRGVYTYRL